MNGTDFLRRLTKALDKAQVPYMLAGSTASSFHGEPRSTNDIDLVVELTPAGVRELRRLLPESDYYFDEQTALSAVRMRRQFNVIDMATGWKADLIVRRARPFSVEEFGRRRQVDFDGLKVWMAAPEDVVISKLEWAHRAGSQRQLRDVRGVLEQVADLDLDYVRRWVSELGLAAEWSAVWPL